MSEDRNIKNDYEYSRDTYYELLEKGKESLELMVEVARESEHPRAFEVLSTMMKNMADINDKLMDLNKKNKDINRKDEPQQLGNTTNNLFVGTTTDLQRLLQKEEQGLVIDATEE
jgi:DNA-binding PadR family transcriptional regulator